MKLLALTWLFAASCYSQEFEAAAIRPASPNAPSQCKGGPGTDDPGRLTCQNFPLSYFVMMAYNLRPYQYQGLDWMSSTRFDLQATIPPGSTVEQFLTMLQNLLAARFKLAVHRATKEMDGYDLVVLNKNPGLKRTAEQADEVPWSPPVSGPPRRVQAQYRGRKESTAELATYVGDRVGRPVHDATGLQGGYDFLLTWTDGPSGAALSVEDDGGVTLESALKDQLGLALVKKKLQVDIVIVDHSEKTPNEN